MAEVELAVIEWPSLSRAEFSLMVFLLTLLTFRAHLELFDDFQKFFVYINLLGH